MSAIESYYYEKLEEVLKTSRHNLIEDITGKLEQYDESEASRLEAQNKGLSGKQSDHLLVYQLASKNLPYIKDEISKLIDVQQAEARIDQGTFGKCLKCGETIGMDRLHTRPTVKYCLSCSGD